MRPLLVEAFEEVTVTDAGGCGVTEADELEGVVVVAGADDVAGGSEVERGVVDEDALEDDGRRKLILPEVCGVYEGDAFARGEPEEAVDGLPGCGVAVGGGFFGGHAVGECRRC